MSDLVDSLMDDDAAEIAEMAGHVLLEVYTDGTVRICTDLDNEDMEAVLLAAAIGDVGPWRRRPAGSLTRGADGSNPQRCISND
ncbi:hypothetical protein [Roseivivax jejudonensis]|uniref:hypothetical protein n=1 Tax=Roseivivax jejudonensis TaxID=1529041 RepID=UPI000A26E8C2|nr:hypothetical protein [Roseivivax jejudonensis]